jgi:hypothetical protein
MPTVLRQRFTGPNFLVSEANGARSREEGQVAPGTAIRSATLLARRDSDQTLINYNPTGTPPGGGQIRGLAYDGVPATGTGTPATRIAYFARDIEYNEDEVDWNGASDAQKTAAKAQLATLGIIPREGL